MNFKNLTLISTSIVALGFSATAAQAVMMGRVDLGFTEWFDNYDFGGQGGFDNDFSSITGMARVNLPYSDRINLQLDLFGDGSLDSGIFSGKGSGYGNFGAGAHINWRDPAQGLLGIFAATGRLWDVFPTNNSPAVMAGLEGQYYCGQWSFYGQAGYMDSDGFFMENAGFLRGLASYYATPKLKIRGGLAYIDGEAQFGPGTVNATAWAWEAGGEYWFGRTMPIAVTLKYQGRDTEEHVSPFNPSLNTSEVTLGLTFLFGGDSIEDADKNGNSTEIPNFDWFRLPGGSAG